MKLTDKLIIVTLALNLCISISIFPHKLQLLSKNRTQLHPLSNRGTFKHKRNTSPCTFDTTDFQDSTTKMWSILIPTLTSRKISFDFIYHKLKNQIEAHGLSDNIEILYFEDDGTHSIGFKRNALLQQSKALYISYVDDDDDVSDDYIPIIYEKLLRRPDCVSLMGIKTVDGQDPKTFIHSNRYTHWFTVNGKYYRCPNHLNPIRRAIARHFLFPEISQGEDADWSLQIAELGLIKTEEVINKPYYFYLCKTHKDRPNNQPNLKRNLLIKKIGNC